MDSWSTPMMMSTLDPWKITNDIARKDRTSAKRSGCATRVGINRIVNQAKVNALKFRDYILQQWRLADRNIWGRQAEWKRSGHLQMVLTQRGIPGLVQKWAASQRNCHSFRWLQVWNLIMNVWLFDFWRDSYLQLCNLNNWFIANKNEVHLGV